MTTPLLFWDVDTQVDFMLSHGKLYVEGSEEIRENLARLTRAAREHEIPVVASADDHEPSDAELSDEPDFVHTYPPHCLRGTPGVRRVPETDREDYVEIGHEPLSEEEIAERLDDRRPLAVLIHKKRFDVFTNPNTEKVVAALDPEQIVLYGVALDVCDRYAVEGLLERGYANLTLVIDAARAIRPEEGERLVAEWRGRGVEIATTDEILAELDG